MSGIRVNEWLHNSGTGGIWQTSAGNVGIASSVPTTKLEVTGDAKISGVSTAAAFIPAAGQLSNRNLVINGDFTIAQRSTATSTSSGYYTVDRFRSSYGGTDEAPTYGQHSLTSADTGPWEKGFRKSFHVTNGNQTSGFQAGSYVNILYYAEAQDIAQSGWNYASDTSYITVSYWARSSVAQNFYHGMSTHDGTGQWYPWETGTLSANTWTYITKTIPGNSNITINNDNGAGLTLTFSMPGYGTNFTTSGRALNTWAEYTGSQRSPDVPSATWYTTNDATFEITGVQLEVGTVATPFEHRSFGDQLARCRRYYYDYMYQESSNQYGTTNANRSLGVLIGWSATEVDHPVKFPVPMRAIPSLDQTGGANYVQIEGAGASSTYVDGTWTLQFGNVNGCNLYATPDTNVTAGNIYHGVVRNASMKLAFSAEF